MDREHLLAILLAVFVAATISLFVTLLSEPKRTAPPVAKCSSTDVVRYIHTAPKKVWM